MTGDATMAPIGDGLVVSGVVKHFRGVEALKGISLRVPEQGILGLIGPNGSGKTTLLNVASGVLGATSGSVFCRGVDITKLGSHEVARLGVRRTFQNIRLFGHLSVKQNVEVGAISSSEAKAHGIPAVVNHLMARFDLTPLAEAAAGQVPYGAQRRVEIARALAGYPRFLLLDEPAAGLNELESDRLLEDILAAREEFICGILVVDHDLRLIMRLCERIHVLAEGSTLAEGSPDEVRCDQAVVDAFLGDAVSAESCDVPASQAQRVTGIAPTEAAGGRET